jgi:hypothetical protein
MKKDSAIKIPDYSCIKNSSLRNQLEDANGLVLFLLKLNISTLNVRIQKNLYKSISIQLVSIIEVLILYIILGKVKDVGSLKGLEKTIKRFSFSALLKVVRDLSLVPNQLINRCLKVKQWRNKIHLEITETQFIIDLEDIVYEISIIDELLNIIKCKSET